MKIEYDPFVLKQFKPDFKGTNLSKIDQKSFLNLINLNYDHSAINMVINSHQLLPVIVNSDNDFCKYLIFKNDIKEIKSAVAEIDLNIYPFIRTGYSSRTPDELPILSRWAELPPGFSQPMANYIVCILYSREQLEKEFDSKNGKNDIQVPSNPELGPVFYNDKKDFYLSDDVDYGIVAIMGTVNPEADPMVPVTMMRNELGLEAGGNGVKINKESYQKSIEFWEKHILIR